MLGPVGHLFEWPRRKPAGPPLRVSGSRDQMRAFEDFQVLGNCRQGHIKRLGERADRQQERANNQQERTEIQQERIDIAARELAEVIERLQAAADALRASI